MSNYNNRPDLLALAAFRKGSFKDSFLPWFDLSLATTPINNQLVDS